MNISVDRLLFGLIMLVSATILVMVAAEELPKAYWAITPPVPTGSEVDRTLRTLGWGRAETQRRDDGRRTAYVWSRAGRRARVAVRTGDDRKLRRMRFRTDRSPGRSTGPVWRALSSIAPSALQAVKSCAKKCDRDLSDGSAGSARYTEMVRTDWKVTLEVYTGGPSPHAPFYSLDIRRVWDRRVAAR